MQGLTVKQADFVRQYLLDLNATQAAIRAGYSPKGATVRGSELLANRKVQAAIDQAVKDRAERTEVTSDRVIEELARIAFSNISGIVRMEGGRVVVKDTAKLTEGQRRSISGLSETANGIRVKLHDKLRALEMLGRHLGMFTDRHEIGGPGGEPIHITVKPPSEMTDKEIDEELERLEVQEATGITPGRFTKGKPA